MDLRPLFRGPLAGAWLVASTSAWGQAAGFLFEPDHLGIEPTVPKAYFVRLVPPPTSSVQVAVSLGRCAEFVDADAETLQYAPDDRWQRVTLTAKEPEQPEDADRGGEGGGDAEVAHPCPLFWVEHRVTETADVRFQGVRGYLPVEVTANRAPLISNPIPDQALDPAARTMFRLGDVFYEPDGDALRYAATTSDDRAARVFVDDGMLVVVAGPHPGKALVTVVAVEPQDLESEFAFAVRVGALVTFGADVAVPEGGTATLEVAMARPQSVPVAVPFAIGSDGAPATPDADAGEYGAGVTGEVVLAAGETTAAIAIAIADDDRIEPAEESFVVSLLPAADLSYALERAAATVVVREGVCDRTPQVRDALSRVYDALLERLVPRPCSEPTVAALATRPSLHLAAAGIDGLRRDDLLGLAALRLIDLRANRLQTLPTEFFRHAAALRVVDLGRNRLRELDPAAFAPLEDLFALRLDGNLIAELPGGLFAGQDELFELRLDDNPGAPFPVGVTLVRTDAGNFAPPPATIHAQFAPHAPFALTSALTVEGGTASMQQVVLSPGQGESEPIVVSSAGGGTRVTAAAPRLPDTLCAPGPNRKRCFRGMSPVAAPPLVLFAAAPTVLATAREGAAVAAELAAGDTVRIPLGDVFATADGRPLRYAAAVEPPVIAWRIVDGVLLLTADEGGGMAVVTVTATAAGLTASFSFAVTTLRVGHGFASGWRRALGEAAPGS